MRVNMKKYVIEQINIDSNGNNIYGLLYKSIGNNKMPLVIYSHELANTHERGILYAEYLASNGFATYIFDYPGGSSESKSDGKTTEMSVLTEKKDLENVVNYFRKQDGIDVNNIFIIGASLGGLVAALYAAEHKEYIKSLILLYPGFVVCDAAHEQFHSLEEVPKEFSFKGWINVGKKYISDIWRLNPYDCIGKYDKSVLILHGDNDQVVPLEYSKKAIDVYPNAKLEIISNANHHIFFKECQVKAQEKILEFIKKKIVYNKKKD